LRLDFDRRLMLQFRGFAIKSNAGLLAYRELDATLGLTDMSADALAYVRTGKNGRHRLVGLRQSVFGRLAGYEDVNDAERLRRDPAMRWVVGDRAITVCCLSELVGPLRSEVAEPAREPRRTSRSSKVHQRRPPKRIVLDMDSEPNLWRAGRQLSKWPKVAVSRQMSADILSLIARLRAPPVPAMRQATTAEVRLDVFGTARFSAEAWSTGGFQRHLRATNVVAHCSNRSKGDHGLEPAGNLANVG